MKTSQSQQQKTLEEIKGLKMVEDALKQIRVHEKTFVVFEISSIDPVMFNVVKVGGLNTSGNVRATPPIDNLTTVFDECVKSMDGNKPYFIGYDFGYYTASRDYRNMILLISYIPDSINFRQKIAYASNVSLLLNKLNIPLHVEAHDMEDITFKRIVSHCSSIQRE